MTRVAELYEAKPPCPRCAGLGGVHYLTCPALRLQAPPARDRAKTAPVSAGHVSNPDFGHDDCDCWGDYWDGIHELSCPALQGEEFRKAVAASWAALAKQRRNQRGRRPAPQVTGVRIPPPQERKP